MADDEGPDYRHLLANERTFLAYVRTTLSLQAVGLAVLQFLTDGHEAVRIGLGVGLVAAGSLAGLGGLARFRDNDRRIRAGLPMHTPRVSAAVVVAVAVLPLVAAVALSLG